MRTALRSLFVTALPGCALLAACRGGTVPNQVLTKPAVANVPAPAAHSNGPWSYRPSTQRQGFVVDQRALVTIRFDTATQTDTVSAHVEVAFTADPAANSISGSVTAFLVQGAGHAAATPVGLTTPFPLRAEFAGHGPQLDFTVPREAVPCASAALAAVQSLRDLWFKPPDTLRTGTMWQDSSSYVVCRDGISLHSSVRRTFNVVGIADGGGRLLLSVSRIARTTIVGAGAQFGEAVGVNGTGSGQLFYSIDPASGEVVSATGSTELELSLRSRLRSQVVRQTVEIRIGRT